MSISLTPQEWAQRDVKSLATSLALGKTLFTTGNYTLETLHELGPGKYFVRRPEPLINTKTGELIEGYEVDLVTATCTCPLFVRLASRAHLPGYEDLKPCCKHLWATQADLLAFYERHHPLIKADIPLLLGSQPHFSASLVPSVSAPQIPNCPDCGKQMRSMAKQGHPEAYHCSRCVRFWDDASLMLREDALHVPGPLLRAGSPPAFATAPNPVPPSPRSTRSRRFVTCQRCHVAMDESTNERTGQEGHRCAVCGDFLPLGSLRPIPAPQAHALTVSY